MKKLYPLFLTAMFLLLFFLMLAYPAESLYYAFTGLILWFQKMIPTLFPFMILSGIMIRMNLTEYFSMLLTPLFRPLFHVNGNGAYCIILGFLCGFPMGAKVIADLYEREKLSQEEASRLLAFCNNIGPIYMISFVLPILGLTKKLPYLFGMYGIPLLYGIYLGYKSHNHNVCSHDVCLYNVRFHNIRCQSFRVQGKRSAKKIATQVIPAPKITAKKITAKKIPAQEMKVQNAELRAASMPSEKISILAQIDASIMSGIENITRLGGYMILFNLLNLFPAMLLPAYALPYVNALLEITSGISRMGSAMPLAVLLLLPFGGFSCIAQTYSIIKNTDLSIGAYCFHKILLTLLTAVFYGAWFGFCQLVPAVPFLP